MEDPEEAFIRRRAGFQGAALAAAAAAASPRSARISGDVSMEASNASEDGTLRLRQVKAVDRSPTCDPAFVEATAWQ